MVARMGGDEFTLLLPGIAGTEDAALIAGRLVRSLAEPIPVNDAHCQIGTSVGVALFPDHGRDMDTLVARADAAMYLAKRGGRDRVVVVGPGRGPPVGSEPGMVVAVLAVLVEP